MKTYNIEYKVGGYGCINIDVDMDVPRDNPNFMQVLQEKADNLIISEIERFGVVDFIHTQD